jgi:predicted RNase H-like nuclease (RuvC/YqgF family)
MLNDEDINKLKSVFATKEDFGGLATKSDINGLKSDFTGLRSEVGELKSDFTGLRFEVGELKSDFTGLRSEVGELKSDFDGLRFEIKSFKLETRESFTKLNEKIEDLTEVVMGNIDKRVEVLEEKVLA